MERLRHHLMPLYNFDPQEEDWESELLDDRGRKLYSKEVVYFYFTAFLCVCFENLVRPSRQTVHLIKENIDPDVSIGVFFF